MRPAGEQHGVIRRPGVEIVSRRQALVGPYLAAERADDPFAGRAACGFLAQRLDQFVDRRRLAHPRRHRGYPAALPLHQQLAAGIRVHVIVVESRQHHVSAEIYRFCVLVGEAGNVRPVAERDDATVAYGNSLDPPGKIGAGYDGAVDVNRVCRQRRRLGRWLAGGQGREHRRDDQ